MPIQGQGEKHEGEGSETCLLVAHSTGREEGGGMPFHHLLLVQWRRSSGLRPPTLFNLILLAGEWKLCNRLGPMLGGACTPCLGSIPTALAMLDRLTAETRLYFQAIVDKTTEYRERRFPVNARSDRNKREILKSSSPRAAQMYVMYFSHFLLCHGWSNRGTDPVQSMAYSLKMKRGLTDSCLWCYECSFLNPQQKPENGSGRENCCYLEENYAAIFG